MISSLLSSLFCLAAFSFLATAVVLEKKETASFESVTPAQWAALNKAVGGRLHPGMPLAKPCYSFYHGKFSKPDLEQCNATQTGYTDEIYVINQFGGYMNTNWGMCQAKAQHCTLDFSEPADPTYYAPPANCFQGSVPSYYINVAKVSDAQAALAFAHKTGVPLVIKNSGHDYKGRSSAPGSLALWTHNIQPEMTLTENFVPEGCSTPVGKTVTMGAGEDFVGLYEFAEAHNVTVVGGSARTVGPVGGWISAAGHGALSNTLGLGVDNVMQIKAVLPNGTYVTANECQHQDIFFALRGGGGGTFSINMEMTTRAHPKLTLQVAYIRFISTDTQSIQKFIALCTQNADKWASEGWGGYIAPGAESKQITGMIFFTPVLTHAEAVKSMKPITDLASSLGTIPLNNSVRTSPSFLQAYNTYILPNEEKVGLPVAIGSRLIPRTMLQSTSGQQIVAKAIETVAKMVVPPDASQSNPLSLTYGAPLQILVTAPSSYKGAPTTSSVTPAWYEAIWHTVLAQGFLNNPTVAEINAAFKNAHNAAQVLRDIAPNSGAYQNEADVFEPNPEQAYWGQENYEKLLKIKREIDPNNVLTCWDCIGWDKTDPRYACYPKI